mmetsp:Transcript_20828/g.32047  ORF Transcript_20828/g.32047 Transcript_20828/m.32047 type:complete len:264 (-) Transcript_20828:982-1773(-)
MKNALPSKMSDNKQERYSSLRMDEAGTPSHVASPREEHYMREALKVAQAALSVGEVPVGCVIVLRDKDVIVSHGANQVNATRDATRHAEVVSIDRMLTGGIASDKAKLPMETIAKSAHGAIPSDSALLSDKIYHDKWVNVPDDPNHWRNTYGWGSGRTYDATIFPDCDLYVTCEPCIMCAAALARVKIGRVFFGCRNDRFGGCGSLLHLHKEDAIPSKLHEGYHISSGILEDEAVSLLRSFYDRENFHAPDDKRKRKDIKVDD